MTQSGDTLWEIALTARPDRGTSVQAMMLAIQSRNPSAFMNQNINRLKAGYVLVMPDQEDLDRITFESALAEVASQNSEQLVPASQKKNPPPEPSADSELVLVAVDVDAAEDLSAASAEVLAATDVAQGLDENLNTRAAIERDVLAGRLASLESKLESLASTISLKDQQILALQKQLKTLEALPKPVPESSFLTPMSVAFMVALVVLVVVLLLMSARYQRLTRSLRAATASPVASELQVSSPAPMVAEASSASDTARESALTASLAATGNSESVAPLSADAAAETEITTSASAMSSEPMAGATTPLDASPAVDAVSDVDSDQGMAAETAVQVEDTFPELDLSELEALDDLSELEELDLSDLSDLSESDVASELGIDPDEDPANMLDLARAYVDMGDSDAARNLLNRVSVIGTASEVTEAKKMLVSLSDD
jgi:FimV-like protein